MAEKYDMDFDDLVDAEKALNHINLRRHRHNPTVRATVTAARWAVVQAYNALLEVEQKEENPDG